jgi:DNA-directed RNA polymerase subunit RPC12/RpoP
VKTRYEKTADKLKFSYEHVKQIFADQGCELLDEEYKNARTPLNYRCSCGNTSKIVLDSFKRGNRCRKCGFKKIAQKLKETRGLTHEYVHDYFVSQGCKLLEKEYIDSQTLMRYTCVCGTDSIIRWNNFQRGRRCKECQRIRITGKNNYQWREDREALALEMSFKDRCHKALTHALKYTGKKKAARTLELLGYDWRQLKDHIESHPNWLSVKDGDWHLDHIIPVKAFIDHGVWNLKIINDLSNLQPLSSSDNAKKNAKYDKADYENYIKNLKRMGGTS